MNNPFIIDGRQPRGNPGRGGRGSRGGRRGHSDGSSNWRQAAQNRTIILPVGLSSSTGNLYVQNVGAVAGYTAGGINLLRNPNELYGGSYFESNQPTRGTLRKNANDASSTNKKLRGNPGRGGRPHGGGRRGTSDESSPWRHAAQHRLVNLQTGLSSSTDTIRFSGNLNVQSRGAIPRHNAGNDNSDSPEPYFEPNQRTRKSANQNDNPRLPRGKFRFGYKALVNLLGKPPEEIIMDILGKKDALKELMASKLEPDLIVLLIHVFATACSSKFEANTGEVLMLLLDDKYMQQLLQYVMQLPLQEQREKLRNKDFWNKVEEFWSNLWFLFSQLLERIPTIAVDVLPKYVNAAVYTLQNFEAQQNVSISEETYEKFENLQDQLIEARDIKESGGAKRGGIFDEESPPDNFREISIYPKPEELSADARPFVRSNVIEGSYRDVEHYLDVQFRLLREDFVAPLREGINEYLYREDKKKRLSNIKVYTKVKCMGMERVQNQMGYIVQVVKPGSIRNVEHTKRFMFGSLICFTTDNFATILFGKVINRDKAMLQLGRVVIGFDIDISLEPEVEYTMAECTVYFEPYYQVLSALQKMDGNDFPLKNYLVDVNFVAEPPLYVLQSPVFDIDSFQVNVMLRESWPHHERIQLNESQFEAFNFAINNKMCVIQGPPGTGKTYLALQIAKMLLKNHTKWKSFGPILLICYTNHALDQFLEGLLDTTESLVRVGGQSRSEKLGKFNIKELRKKSYMRGQSVLREKSFDVRHLAADIQSKAKVLDLLNKCESIIKFSEFDDVDERFEMSWFAKNNEDSIIKWLLEESNQEEWAKANKNIEPIETFHEEEVDDEYIDERTQNIVDIEDEFLKSIRGTVQYNFEMLTMAGLQKKQQDLAQQLQTLDPTTYEHFLVVSDYNRAVINTEYLQYRLHQLRTGRLNVRPTKIDLDNPYRMSFDDRWRLYALWVTKYREDVERKIRVMDERYRIVYKKYEEIREMSDTSLLRENLVIGMTTTGAAKLQTLLQALKCPIVIVEEAAEVLESHVITALTGSCQQLLLIGDHKQLRPSTADYNMDVHYNLGISLFERMIKNEFPCNTLNVQHRMRPEIANLVAPTIYPNLRNHHSVLNFEEIKGVDKSLYFITHQHAEQESSDQSKENSHEATFLLLLAQYLVLNGYEAQKITLLAAYSGQLFRLLKERRNYFQLRELNIKVLDNYQGEENDIILLSLVRNNTDEKIGFLHLENRVCVALSRARKGMYVMGNMDLLCRKSKIWPKIREVLERQNSIGDFLLLRCQRHPDQETEVRCGNDFKKVPEGGCLKLCGSLLECGHNCDRLCHIVSHNQLPCKQPCTKIICEFDHVCPKKCCEKCEKCMVPKSATLPCGHELKIPCHMSPEEVNCPIEIDATLPCGHDAKKKCYLDVNVVRCGVKCDVRVEPCGHSCLRNCHINNDPDHEQYKCMKDCERQNKRCSQPDDPNHKCRKRCYEKCSPCDIKVDKTRTVCPHRYKVSCSEDVDEIECKRKCTKMLPCGHKCKRNCNEECGGCKEMVEKVVEVCGHKVKCACSVTPTRSLCYGKCELLLKCGHKCTKKCRDNCDTVKCQQLVTASNVSCPNGHNLTVPCHLSGETTLNDKLLKHCSEKCTVQLECGHRCSGTCGSCAQGRVHADCAEKCNKILVCGHECAVPCRSMCQPCTLQCPYRCGHSRCARNCGSACTPCQEPCERRCPHVQCRKKCHEICEVEPCKEPCTKKLKCGHDCIGFCGDKCPPLCRTCDAETVTECFFGTEDDEDARFVYLPDCKHVVESSGLEQWIQTTLVKESGNEISVVRCPKCKEFITCLQRYDELLKLSLKDVEAVKNKFNGNVRANNARLRTLLADVQHIGPDMEKLGAKSLYAELKLTLEKGKNKLNQQQLQSYAMKIQILQQLCDTHRTQELTRKEAQEIVHEHVKFLMGHLSERNGFMNNQKVEDLKWEIKRFTRVFQLATIVEKAVSYSVHPEYKKCRELAFGFLRYNDNIDAELKSQLSEFSRKSKSGLNITDAERRDILKAMKMGTGHWYKCPQGHVYAIGDCGGAMQVAKCPECGAQIGGGSHRLLGTNAVATEMDGALMGAYDASMGGYYNIHDLQRRFGGP